MPLPLLRSVGEGGGLTNSCMMAFALSAPISSLKGGIDMKEGMSALEPVELWADLASPDDEVCLELDGAIEGLLIVDIMEWR